MQKEAMIQSFSQDFAAQQRQGEDGQELKESLADFLKQSSGVVGTMHQAPNSQRSNTKSPRQLQPQLKKIPSLGQASSPQGTNEKTSQSARSTVEVELQTLLNKCEVELEAKSHMVKKRDAQIVEFQETITALQQQVE